MSNRHVRLDIGDDIATLWLDRPPCNLLDIITIEQMNTTLLELQRNRSLEVLIVRGTDRCFSEGFDLDELKPERIQRLIQLYMRLFETLRMMKVVQIAAVQGTAFGAGFEVALGCNLFLASESATFALPETSQGLFPPIATAILPRIAPRRKAMEWVLTGNKISAAELHHHGVINRLLPDDGFDAGVASFVAEITSKSGPILDLAKRAQFEAYYSTFPEAMSRTQALFLRELMDLEDAREGVEARRQKRPPKWKNR